MWQQPQQSSMAWQVNSSGSVSLKRNETKRPWSCYRFYFIFLCSSNSSKQAISVFFSIPLFGLNGLLFIFATAFFSSFSTISTRIRTHKYTNFMLQYISSIIKMYVEKHAPTYIIIYNIIFFCYCHRWFFPLTSVRLHGSPKTYSE